MPLYTFAKVSVFLLFLVRIISITRTVNGFCFYPLSFLSKTKEKPFGFGFFHRFLFYIECRKNPYSRPASLFIEITRENDVWVIRGKEIEKFVIMSRLDSNESVLRFSNKLRKFGIDDELKELGAKEGDTVRILDFEFEYTE